MKMTATFTWEWEVQNATGPNPDGCPLEVVDEYGFRMGYVKSTHEAKKLMQDFLDVKEGLSTQVQVHT